MTLSAYLSGLKNVVALARNPNNTMAVFGIVDGLRGVGGGKLERRVVEHLCQHAENRALIEERYAAAAPALSELSQLAEGSLGRVFAEHLLLRNLRADFYPKLAIHSDASFVAMRMRQTHDIWHVVTGFETDVPGELGLQAFVLAQLHTPLATVILCVGLLRSIWEPVGLDNVMDEVSRGFAMGRKSRPLFAQKWELAWNRPLSEWRAELGIADFFEN